MNSIKINEERRKHNLKGRKCRTGEANQRNQEGVRNRTGETHEDKCKEGGNTRNTQNQDRQGTGIQRIVTP